MNYEKIAVRVDQVDEISNAIKTAILQGVFSNSPKDLVEASISKLIRDGCNSLPGFDRQMINSLGALAQKLYLELRNNVANILSSLKIESKKVVKSYTFDQKMVLEMGEEKFRNLLTSLEVTAPIIKDYENRIRAEFLILSTKEPRVTAAGRTINLRAYAEMKVRFDESQSDIARLKSEGTKYAFLSSHANCSKRCEPWQGKLVDLAAPARSSDCRTGEILDGNAVYSFSAIEALDGGNSIINGYNCRHYLIPYSPNSGQRAPSGFEKRRIEQERQIDEKKTYYENRIRKLKQEVAGETIAKKRRSKIDRLEKYQERYKDFCASNNRSINPNRIRNMKAEIKLKGTIETIDIDKMIQNAFTVSVLEQMKFEAKVKKVVDQMIEKLKREMIKNFDLSKS